MPGVKGMKWGSTPERDARRTAAKLRRKAYQRWHNMMERCYNPEHPKYPGYGDRGIRVQDVWHDFDRFYKDTGNAPEGLSLDRPDNNADYGPDNWRWTTTQEQLANRRRYRDKTAWGPGRYRK